MCAWYRVSTPFLSALLEAFQISAVWGFLKYLHFHKGIGPNLKLICVSMRHLRHLFYINFLCTCVLTKTCHWASTEDFLSGGVLLVLRKFQILERSQICDFSDRGYLMTE